MCIEESLRDLGVNIAMDKLVYRIAGSLAVALDAAETPGYLVYLQGQIEEALKDALLTLDLSEPDEWLTFISMFKNSAEGKGRFGD